MADTYRCVRIATPPDGPTIGTAHPPPPGERPPPFDVVVLTSNERRVRRTLLPLAGGDRVALDLPEPVTLKHGDRLVLEDGREAEVIAGEERLLEVTAADPARLPALAWHIGNRHAPAQVEAGRILIAHDAVLARMLEGLGAAVREVSEPFEPERGAYHASGHSHGQSHRHSHGRSHDH